VFFEAYFHRLPTFLGNALGRGDGRGERQAVERQPPEYSVHNIAFALRLDPTDDAVPRFEALFSAGVADQPVELRFLFLPAGGGRRGGPAAFLDGTGRAILPGPPGGRPG